MGCFAACGFTSQETSLICEAASGRRRDNGRFDQSDRLRQESTIHADVGSRDEAAGLFTGQKNCRADQFVRFAESTGGGVTQDRLSTWRRRAIGIVQQRPVL